MGIEFFAVGAAFVLLLGLLPLRAVTRAVAARDHEPFWAPIAYALNPAGRARGHRVPGQPRMRRKTFDILYTAPPKWHRTFECQVRARTKWGARRVFRRQNLLRDTRIFAVHRAAS
jgi:hypothetical protein